MLLYHDRVTVLWKMFGCLMLSEHPGHIHWTEGTCVLAGGTDALCLDVRFLFVCFVARSYIKY